MLVGCVFPNGLPSEVLARWSRSPLCDPMGFTERKVRDYDVKLPADFLGFLMVNALQLDSEKTKLLLNDTKGSLGVSDVKGWLRVRETDLGISNLGHAKKKSAADLLDKDATKEMQYVDAHKPQTASEDEPTKHKAASFDVGWFGRLRERFREWPWVWDQRDSHDHIVKDHRSEKALIYLCEGLSNRKAKRLPLPDLQPLQDGPEWPGQKPQRLHRDQAERHLPPVAQIPPAPEGRRASMWETANLLLQPSMPSMGVHGGSRTQIACFGDAASLKRNNTRSSCGRSISGFG